MKKLLILATLLFSFSIASAGTLYDFYSGNLPTLKERAKIYLSFGYYDDYKGTAKQNTDLLSELENMNEEVMTLGAASFAVGGESYNLAGSGISSSATSIILSKFGYTQPNKVYYEFGMGNFGELGCLTLEPGINGRQEFVSFTGVTQNSSNSQTTLTRVVRGL